jgi:hypothetical protein
MRRFIEFLICIGAVFCAGIFDKALATPCASSGTTLFFVNGVYNFTYASARQALFALESATSAPSGASPYKYELAYNPGDGYFVDLIEAAAQKLGVNSDRTYFTLWLLGETSRISLTKITHLFWSFPLLLNTCPVERPNLFCNST